MLRLRGLLFGLFLSFGLLGYAQPPVKPADTNPPEKKADYSQEAYVFEQGITKIVFENDGTDTRSGESRIRIQSDAGVQRYGVLSFPYESAIESLDIDYVRVRKPDGTVVSTPVDTAQDMPTEITRQAPFYSDQREKQVAVKGLSVGDVLEYEAHWRTTKPLAPGQFWYAYNFVHDFIFLQEQLQISVPRDRAVKWKSPTVNPVITEDAGHRIFTWNSSQLQHKSSDEEKKDKEQQVYDAARGKLPPPEVQISSFQSWDEIGSWYNSLQLERVKPTPEIRAKAAELTKNASDDRARMFAIYNYVSMQFRYIGVAFGIGRYQPHAAAEVLSNQYGDCKDKHTLLASLLDAVGIQAYPALISIYRDLDSDVPSPAQFDHVITVVPQGKDYVWLDATAEVAPFGYLVGALRDKPALVIIPGKTSNLVTTAADPPTKAKETFKIEATLKEDGTLDGKVDRTIAGNDAEVILRGAFRRVPLPQWKDLVQQISYSSGFAGDVSEVTASSPEKTDDPFHFAYTYHRKDYPDWSDRRISSPLPPMLTPAPETKPSHPILLGALGEFQYQSRVELPKGYSPQLPANVELKEDFAEYRVTYSVKGGALQTERDLVVKLREIPISEYETYKKFAKAVSDDHELYVALSSGDSQPESLQSAVANLPASDNSEAMRAFADAMSEARRGNMPGVTDALNQAVKADPHFARAWLMLASIYGSTGQREKGLDIMRKAHEADPHDSTLARALVAALMEEQKSEEAVSVLQAIVKSEPANSDTFSALGVALAASKRYDEAAVAVESAIKLAPDRAGLYAQLGSACMHAGKEDKASEAFKKAVELDSSPFMLNNVGYEMADAGQNLPLSLEYAQKAVRGEEELTQQINLSDLKDKDLGTVSSLAAYWDTLGWVHFKMGSFNQAEKYLAAAWTLSQDPTVADHLGQVYEQQHKKDQAVHMYTLALAAARKPEAMKDTQARLDHLGKAPKTDRLKPSGGEQLSKLRTVTLPNVTSESASAEFFLLFGAGSKVAEVKFVSGSEKLKSADKALTAASFEMPLPDDGPTRLVRRGILSCSSISGCVFVLYTPDSVRSVN